MFEQFTNYVQKNVGTTPVTLLTVPANNQLLLNQLSCANVTNFNVTVSVSVQRSGTEAFVVRNATVPAGSALTCVSRQDQKIVLMAGDTVRVVSSTATSIDVIASGVLNDFNRAAAVPAPVTVAEPIYVVFPNVSTVDERGFSPNTVNFGITATVPNGTQLFWDIQGTVDASDFTDGQLEGAVTISGSQGAVPRTFTTDPAGEGQETLIFNVRPRPAFLGGGVMTSTTVIVRDTPVTSGLIMWLDAGNPNSYSGSGADWFDITNNENHVELRNGPTYNSTGAIVFNGTNQWARTFASINLSTFNAVTVEIVMRVTNSAVTGCAWEHTADWNTNPGGIGLFTNNFGAGYQLDSFHTNHNTGPARNYVETVGTNWVVHTNIYSRVGDDTGRLSYVNGVLESFVAGPSGYATGTATSGGSFAFAPLFFASRAGTGSYNPMQIAQFRVYNRKLSAAEVLANFRATRFPT